MFHVEGSSYHPHDLPMKLSKASTLILLYDVNPKRQAKQSTLAGSINRLMRIVLNQGCLVSHAQTVFCFTHPETHRMRGASENLSVIVKMLSGVQAKVVICQLGPDPLRILSISRMTENRAHLW